MQFQLFLTSLVTPLHWLVRHEGYASCVCRTLKPAIVGPCNKYLLDKEGLLSTMSFPLIPPKSTVAPSSLGLGVEPR